MRNKFFYCEPCATAHSLTIYENPDNVSGRCDLCGERNLVYAGTLTYLEVIEHDLKIAKYKRLTADERADVVTSYANKTKTVNQMMKEYGVTKMAIYKIIKSHIKLHNESKKIVVKCSYCGREFLRVPSQLNRVDRPFCSSNCNSKFLVHPGLVKGEMTLRDSIIAAKKVVRKYFDLESTDRVCVVNGDWGDARINNLVALRQGRTVWEGRGRLGNIYKRLQVRYTQVNLKRVPVGFRLIKKTEEVPA